MGGCCSSGRPQPERVPVYFYCPPVLEHDPFSPTNGTISAFSSGVLVDINLDTSTPDTYRAPPAPLPYDVGLVLMETLNAERMGASATCDGLKESNGKEKVGSTHKSPDVTKAESMNFSDPTGSTLEEDVCPICLEDYDVENPRTITKCEHYFHLSCILEWMERSDACPMCDQVAVLNHALSN